MRRFFDTIKTSLCKRHGGLLRPVALVVFWILAPCLLTLPSAARADGPIALQIKPLTLPAISEKGYRGRTTLTPYIKVTNTEAMRRVCGRLPRLLDVIQVAFDEDPVHLDDRANDLARRQEVLREQIEGTIGKGVFEEFHLVQGSKTVAEGTQTIDIPGGTRECQPLKYFPWEAVPTTVADKMAQIAANNSGAGTPGATGASGSSAGGDEVLPSPEEIERERKKLFPPEPPKPRSSSSVTIALVVLGLAGVMLIAGSYIGYQIAKIRRDRRRRERRHLKKDRRIGGERRVAESGPPEGQTERRSGKDRRLGDERRKKRDRRIGSRAQRAKMRERGELEDPSDDTTPPAGTSS